MFETEILKNLITILPNYSSIVSFVATLIGGENGLLFVSFLSGQGFFYLPIVIIFSFFAMISLDSFWFFFSKTKLFKNFKNSKKISKHYLSLEKHINKLSNGRDMLLLFIAKVLVGTRILVIVYLSSKKISFKAFTKYNTLPTFLWALLLGILGWLSGKGFTVILDIFDNLRIAISFLILLILIYYTLTRGINKWLIKRQKKLF